MGDSWCSTISDDWKSEDESEKQKMYSVSVGPVEYEQGQLVTPDGDWENAEVVGKCSFYSDFVSSQRFLIKEHFNKLTQEFTVYSIILFFRIIRKSW